MDEETHVFACYFCNTSVTFENHYSSCSIASVHDAPNRTFLFLDDVYYCKKCPKKFSEKEAWRKHSRLSEHNFEVTNNTPSAIKPTEVSSLQNLSMTSLTEDEKTIIEFCNVFEASAKIVLRVWLAKNRSIETIILRKYFSAVSENALRHLESAIKILPYEELEVLCSKIKWRKYLPRAENLLDVNFIRSVVEKLTPSVGKKLAQAVNRIYKKHYLNVLPLIEVPEYKPESSREKKALNPYDFLCLIESLFSLKIDFCVHVALDLLILFQTGQRFTSDRHNLKAGIASILSNTHDENAKYIAFPIYNKKTRKNVTVAINKQLYLMLKEFQWNDFYFPRLINRLSSYLEFNSYALRRTLASILLLSLTEVQRQSVQAAFGHTRWQITALYAYSGLQTERFQFVERWIVPNLRFEFIKREELRLLLPDIAKEAVIPIPKELPACFLSWMKSRHGNTLDYCAKNETNFENIPEILNQTKKKKKREKEKEENINQEREVQSSLDHVIIRGYTIGYSNRIFEVADFFKLKARSPCFKCNLDDSTQRACQHCHTSVHLRCIDLICPYCMVNEPKHFAGFFYKGEGEGPDCLNLKMIRKENDDFIKNVTFLLGVRGMTYTTTLVNSLPHSIDVIEENAVENVILSEKYESYVNGSCVPPLRLGVSGFPSYLGTGFGIFAAADLDENVFIGEYAAEIISRKQLIHAKPDSSMEVFGKYYIAPIIYSGYVPLINEARDNVQPNCRSQLCSIENRLRVILYTQCKIKKDEELLYHYETAPLQTFKYCKLVNSKVYCYYNSVIQFLFGVLTDEAVNTCKEPLKSILKKVAANASKKKRINLKNEYEQLNFNLELNIQQDAHEALLKFLDFIPAELYEFKEKIVHECQNCHEKVEKIDKLFVKSLDARQEDIQKYFNGQIMTQIVKEYFCESCSVDIKKNSCIETVQISSYPKILFLHLTRYTAKMEKDLTRFNPIFIHKSYDFIGMIVHQGAKREMGHYYTLLGDFECGYIKLSDEIIEPCEIDEENCYIIAYERKESAD